MDTAIYYTLSTIAQTLAAAVGFLAAFLIIRLSALEGGVRDRVRYLYDNVGGDHEDLRKILRTDAGKEMLAKYRALFDKWQADADKGKWAHGYNTRSLAHLTEGEAMQAAIDDIVANSRTVLVIAGAVVMACFLGLASAPWLASTAVRARTTLVAAAVAGGVALAVVGRLVMRALRA